MPGTTIAQNKPMTQARHVESLSTQALWGRQCWPLRIGLPRKDIHFGSDSGRVKVGVIGEGLQFNQNMCIIQRRREEE